MRTLFLVAVLLFGSVAFAADEKPSIQNESLRVTADGEAGQFSIQSLPAQKAVVKGARLNGAEGDARKVAVNDSIFGAGEAIQWRGGQVMLFPKLPFVLVRGSVKNETNEVKVVNQVPLVSCSANLEGAPKDLVTLGTDGLRAADKNPGSYTWLAVAEPASRHAVVAGWLTQDRASGILFTKIDGDAVNIAARSDYGRLRLAPGATAETETLAIGYFDDGRLGLEAWDDAVAKQYHIHLPPQPAGFCTWYAEKHGGAADEKSLAALCDVAAKELKPFGFSFVQIDDKWQQGDSQKNGPNKNFTAFRVPGPYQSGMKETADNIKRLGLTPGIWFMPFAGTYNDPWFAEHPDWFVKRADGKPYDVAWGGTSLDTTNPAVRDYVRDVVDRIAKQWGYTYFKLDGLYTGMAVNPRYVNAGYKNDDFGDAVFYNPEKTNVEIYRDNLKLVRDAAGGPVFLLGCNVAQNMRTLGASFGLLDAMRIGPDNSGSWDRWSTRSPVAGSHMYFLNGRIWYNDPDPNYERSSIPLEDARTIASWSAISGQLNSNSDWIPDLPPERLELLKRTMQAHGKTARPVDLFEHDPPRIWTVTDEHGRNVIALFNWSDADQKIDIDLPRCGLAGKNTSAVFDFWKNEFLSSVTSTLSTTLPKHGCQILAVREIAADRPVALSTSEHVTQGMIDVLAEKWETAGKDHGGTLSGRSKVIGGDAYELRIALPASQKWKVARAEVSPDDAAAGAAIKFAESDLGARATITTPADREVNWKVVFIAAKAAD